MIIVVGHAFVVHQTWWLNSDETRDFFDAGNQGVAFR